MAAGRQPPRYGGREWCLRPQPDRAELPVRRLRWFGRRRAWLIITILRPNTG